MAWAITAARSRCSGGTSRRSRASGSTRRSGSRSSPPSTRGPAWCGASPSWARSATAIPVLERVLELCRTFGLSLWLPPFASRLGLGLALAGRAPEAVPLIERAVAQSDAMRLVAGHSLVLCCLGEAYLRAGRAGDARDVARRALTLARSQGERGHEAGRC